MDPELAPTCADHPLYEAAVGCVLQLHGTNPLVVSDQLLCDEYEQKTCRMKELEKKLEEIRKAQGEILSGMYSVYLSHMS